MSHQPYDNWIFGQEELTVDQKQELHKHILECTNCNQVYQAWRAAEYQMRAAPLVAPPSGFTHRFQANLEERQKVQKMFQARRFLLLLSVANLVSLVSFIGYILLSGSPAYWLASSLNAFTGLLVWWSGLQQVVVNLVHALPLFVPVALWVIASSTLAILAMVWVTALWRISTKGVIVK
jgi:hypothetical protein